MGASYCPDLLDLLSGLLSYMGIEPPLFFDAKPEALAAILIQGCHLPPVNSLIGLFSTQMELHESPADYYTRVILLSLRIPDLKRVRLPPADVMAVEEALRQALLGLPLPQALDFLHTQLLSGMAISPPLRDSDSSSPLSTSPPVRQFFCWPPGTPQPPPQPPSFRVWVTRKLSPNLAIVDLHCDSVPWAGSVRTAQGKNLGLSHGVSAGNFIQFLFAANDDYPSPTGPLCLCPLPHSCHTQGPSN